MKDEQPQASEPRSENERNAVARGVVVRLSRGNVALQLGKYLTQRDIDLMRDVVLKHEF